MEWNLNPSDARTKERARKELPCQHLTIPDGKIPATKIDWTGSSMPKAWRRRYAITHTVCTVIGVFIGMGLWQLLN